MILSVENLSIEYKDKKLFKPLSFSVNSGDTFSLVGPSGSGKTSIAKAIVQLIDYKGCIKYLGKDLAKLKKEELRNLRREIQIVFQGSSSHMDSKMSIKEQFDEVLNAHNSTYDYTTLLNKFGFTKDDLSKYVNNFSGGQIQRLCILRSLILGPKLLILDEAFNAQDIVSQVNIIKILHQLRDEMDITFILISHDEELVSTLSTNGITL